MDSIRLRKMRKLQNRVAGIAWALLFIGMMLIVGESDREVLQAESMAYYYH